MNTMSQEPWESNKKDEEGWSNDYRESVSHEKKIRKMKKDWVMNTKPLIPLFYGYRLRVLLHAC